MAIKPQKKVVLRRKKRTRKATANAIAPQPSVPHTLALVVARELIVADKAPTDQVFIHVLQDDGVGKRIPYLSNESGIAIRDKDGKRLHVEHFAQLAHTTPGIHGPISVRDMVDFGLALLDVATGDMIERVRQDLAEFTPGEGQLSLINSLESFVGGSTPIPACLLPLEK